MVSVCLALACIASPASAQQKRIGSIEFFGLTRLSAGELRPHLAFDEGDLISFDDDAWQAAFKQTRHRLANVAGVLRPHVGGPLCCTNGELVVYIGIEESSVRGLQFRKPPQSAVRLPREIVTAGAEFMEAMFEAMGRNDFDEDTADGHSLLHAPEARRVQLQFIVLAQRYLPILREVLRDCGDPAERALAAQIVAYTEDKQAVVRDLVRGIRDPSDDVRNNAMRALLVFTKKVAAGTARPLEVPYEPFVWLLGSPIWTDRNKSSAAVESLTRTRDAKLLRLLRTNSLAPLAEMARWKAPGHALPSRTILGRIAGCSEDEIASAIENGRHEEWIDRIPKHGALACAH